MTSERIGIAAFDTFMRGACGDAYRDVLADRLGSDGLDRAVREFAFFFRDEVPAALESQFGEAEASRITRRFSSPKAPRVPVSARCPRKSPPARGSSCLMPRSPLSRGRTT